MKKMLMIAIIILCVCSNASAETIEELQRMAEENFEWAQATLGLKYCNGEGVPKDYNKALYWLTKAAEAGEVSAQNNLAVMYVNGWGTHRNYERAFYWYSKAAEKGYMYAEANLGGMYANGHGVAQNYSQAFYWLNEAAVQGSVQAQVNLAILYGEGWGVQQDYNKAFYWLQQAADNYDERAMNYLALLYMEGLGVSTNMNKARQLLAEASYYGEGKDEEFNRNYKLILNGDISSLKNHYLAFLSPAGIVTGNNVNVRSGPGTSNIAFTALNKGHHVNVTEKKIMHDGLWLKVIIEGGRVGWMFGKYVDPVEVKGAGLNLFALKINEKNFPDAKFRAFIRLKFDSDRDGILSDSENEKITKLDIPSDEYIQTFRGIEYLKHLRSLKLCAKGVADELDLNSNVMLEELEISEGAMKSLKIDGCKKLRVFLCELRSLDSINLVDLRELKTVRYSIRNHLNILRIKDCPNLEEISNNMLGMSTWNKDDSIDEVEIKGCPNLKRLICGWKVLSSISVEEFPNLEYLSCRTDSDNVVHINLSMNKSLKKVLLDQSIPRLKVEELNGEFYVDLGRYIGAKNIADILPSSIKADIPLASYNAENGTAVFASKPSSLKFAYRTNAAQESTVNVSMTPSISLDEVQKLRTKSANAFMAELEDRGLSVNYRCDFFNSPLIVLVALNGNPDTLRALVEAGADINAVDSNGDNAFYKAIMYNDSQSITQFFLDMGVDPNSRNKRGQTALMLAAQNGCANNARVLISHGANVNAKDPEGRTALMHADYMGSADIFKVLIEAGADVNAQNNEGQTALMLVIDEHTNPDIIKLLLRAGARADIRDNYGYSILDDEHCRELVQKLSPKR